MNKNFTLFPFQEDAVSALVTEFKTLWVNGQDGASLVFKAPTGSGKTIMMAQFLKDLAQDAQFDVDKCFVWISFGGDSSYRQSYNKLFHFYDGASEINLLDISDLSQKKMGKNAVFFINWAKIRASNKEGRVLRAPSERTMKGIDGGVFDEFIINTQKEREIVLIVDEVHLEKDSPLADEVIKLIKPKIQMHISATPKNISNDEDTQTNKPGFVFVEHTKVVAAGLIKEKIISQSEEDITKNHKASKSIDDILLDLADEKRRELKKHYEKLGITAINPLVLIQIPNKTKVDEELGEKPREKDIKNYLLNEKGIKDYEIAIWLSKKKENLAEIVKPNSQVSFLIFKQAVATGWDCPRAQVLVMYREIKKSTFHIQTVGRILRMPEAKHYSISALNQSYLFTNYTKNEVHENEGKLGANQLANQPSTRREEITPIKIKSIYLQRQDYNDLKPSHIFQAHLAKKFDDYFGTKKNIFDKNIKKIKKQEWKFNIEKIILDIIVDAKIANYDNLLEKMQAAKERGMPVSAHDTKKIYNRLCYQVIQNQEKDQAKFAPERSWSVLKSALNVWVMSRLTDERNEAYNVIVNDLLQKDSALKIVLEDVLIDFRSITKKHLKKQSERKKQEKEIEIPLEEEWFTEDYEEVELKFTEKSALTPFYQRKNASSVEKEFVEYLAAKKEIEWWYKNGDSGEKYFSIPYNDDKKLFYPDWFVKLENGTVLILDTKGGWTAKDAKDKIEALHKFLKKENLKDCIAGIVLKHSDIWKVNTNEIYNYDDNCSDFIALGDLID